MTRHIIWNLLFIFSVDYLCRNLLAVEQHQRRHFLQLPGKNGVL